MCDIFTIIFHQKYYFMACNSTNDNYMTYMQWCKLGWLYRHTWEYSQNKQGICYSKIGHIAHPTSSTYSCAHVSHNYLYRGKIRSMTNYHCGTVINTKCYFFLCHCVFNNGRTILSQCPNKIMPNVSCKAMSKWHKQILSYTNNNNMANIQNTNINSLTFSFSVQWVLYRNSTTISFTDRLLLIRPVVCIIYDKTNSTPMVSTIKLIPTTTKSNLYMSVCVLVYFTSFSLLVDNVNSVMSSSSFISPSLLISSLSYDNPVSMATSGPPVLIVSLSSVTATLILIMILTLMLVGLYVTKRRRNTISNTHNVL